MDNMKHIFIDSKWGKISVEFDKDHVVYACSLVGELSYDSTLESWPELEKKFTAYLEGKEVDFNEEIYLKDLPEFTKNVYVYLQENLKWGQVMAYGEIAKAVGNPKAARAIGQVMNKNRVPMFVP
jgi:methylated-DNA-[protein]-cysteine S-methyltransferase